MAFSNLCSPTIFEDEVFLFAGAVPGTILGLGLSVAVAALTATLTIVVAVCGQVTGFLDAGIDAFLEQFISSTASEFLAHLKIEKHPGRLKTLTINDLEAFVKKISQRLSRVSLQHIAGRLRSFLRFLAVTGATPQGLDRQIDTPRVYREEQLPGTLPWETVQTFLNSIDRSSLVGRRDFAMFLLMATYGLRASDIVALTLDDIHWRAGKISISQRKTGTIIDLPLTDAVGTALHRYLKKAPPPLPFRQIFLRRKAPIWDDQDGCSIEGIPGLGTSGRSGYPRERIVPSHSAFVCCVSTAEGYMIRR